MVCVYSWSDKWSEPGHIKMRKNLIFTSFFEAVPRFFGGPFFSIRGQISGQTCFCTLKNPLNTGFFEVFS